MTVSLAYVSSLFPASTSLLDAAYGPGGSGAGSSGPNPAQALAAAELNQTAGIKQAAARADVRTALAGFTKGVKSARNVAGLLANPAVMNVLLTANGMADQIGSIALATKVLLSKLTDTHSLANTLTDRRWKTLASTYDFASNGLKAIQSEKVIALIAAGYAKTAWETAQDIVTPGLANALVFKAKASTIKSIDQILGDRTLRTVITVALGIPEQIAFQSLTTQEQVIRSRLDVHKLQDPKFVEHIVQRYLIANNASASGAASPDLTTLAVTAQGARA